MERTFKGIRADLKLSQSEIAEKMGISSKNYCDKENGNLIFSTSDLIVLNKLSGVSFNELMNMIINRSY